MADVPFGTVRENTGAAYEYAHVICSPSDQTGCCFTDKETGCHQQSCDAAEKTAYEACRQNYFLKQQTQTTQAQTASDGKVQQLQGLLDSQQSQVKELIQQVDSQNQQISVLNTSLRNANILNISLAVIVGIFVVCLISIFIKKIWKKKI
jgi:hypothetical protein